MAAGPRQGKRNGELCSPHPVPQAASAQPRRAPPCALLQLLFTQQVGAPRPLLRSEGSSLGPGPPQPCEPSARSSSSRDGRDPSGNGISSPDTLPSCPPALLQRGAGASLTPGLPEPAERLRSRTRAEGSCHESQALP